MWYIAIHEIMTMNLFVFVYNTIIITGDMDLLQKFRCRPKHIKMMLNNT